MHKVCNNRENSVFYMGGTCLHYIGCKMAALRTTNGHVLGSQQVGIHLAWIWPTFGMNLAWIWLPTNRHDFGMILALSLITFLISSFGGPIINGTWHWVYLHVLSPFLHLEWPWGWTCRYLKKVGSDPRDRSPDNLSPARIIYPRKYMDIRESQKLVREKCLDMPYTACIWV